jgi:hypothetical protein
MRKESIAEQRKMLAVAKLFQTMAETNQGIYELDLFREQTPKKTGRDKQILMEMNLENCR